MVAIETERLLIRQLQREDAPFILRLVNEPAWLRYIGDKGIRNQGDAEEYIRTGPERMYKQLGHGLYLVELSKTAESIGICGLIKREALPEVDLGFAFLSDFRGRGYAYESASAVLSHGRRALGVAKIAAITTPDNGPSIRLLERLGFSCSGPIRLGDGDSELMHYMLDAATSSAEPD